MTERHFGGDMLTAFEEQGYFIARGLLDENKINKFKSAFVELAKVYGYQESSPPNFSDLTKFFVDLRVSQPVQASSFYDTLHSISEFRSIPDSAEFVDLARYLLTGDRGSTLPLYSPLLRCRMDFPSDESTTWGWHQETFYSIPRSKFIQSWAPLFTPLGPQDGAIEILPGSHKEGVCEQTLTFNPHGRKNRAFEITVDSSVVSRFEPLGVDLNLGDVVFFKSTLAHRSGIIRSGMMRLSLVAMFHDVRSPDFLSYKPGLSARNGVTAVDYFRSIFPNKVIDDNG